MENLYQGFQDDQKLAYDLRQAYAYIVADHLTKVAMAREENFYPEYLRRLRFLYIVVKHKISKYDKEDEYSQKIETIQELITKHPQIWQGTKTNNEAEADIESSLYDMEMFLYQKIDDANIFGGNWEDEGL